MFVKVNVGMMGRVVVIKFVFVDEILLDFDLFIFFKYGVLFGLEIVGIFFISL